MTKKKKRPSYTIRKRGRPQELFDINKFKKSLQKSGLDKAMCDEFVSKVDPDKSYCHSTAALFRRTHNRIYKKSKKLAAYYNIKRAILDLGPTGYPFEILCSEIFKAKGFSTEVSVIKKGQFIKHEVDIIATRPDLTLFCECKFHRSYRYRNDIKLPLYIHSRFLDLKNTNSYGEMQYAIISNTNFTLDAIKYAEGVGLLLFSLDYPDRSTFIDLMKQYKVYPVTILRNLRKFEAARLLENKVVVIRGLKFHHLEKIGLSRDRISEVLGEVKELLS